MNKCISVVLPNFNGRNLLADNLPSIYKALTKSGHSFEIIVADDCSTDDSVEFLNKNYPAIKIVSQIKNSGFSSTCNLGVRNTNAKYTCISNTDVTFNEDYFLLGIKILIQSNAFAIKGDIYNYADSIDNIINIDKTTRLYFKRGFLRFRTGNTPGENHSDILEFSALGCCFICNTENFKSLGGFDEIYAPYYWEDSDLALRAINNNLNIIYTAECIAYHKASSTIAATQKSSKRKMISRRNKFIFSWRHMSGINQWSSHIATQILSFFTRWLLLDYNFYISFFFAAKKISRYRKLQWSQKYNNNEY
ncbi:MAG: glycosyltransferase family 2 protein [Thiohalomonadales bacterium]